MSRNAPQCPALPRTPQRPTLPSSAPQRRTLPGNAAQGNHTDHPMIVGVPQHQATDNREQQYTSHCADFKR